MKSAKVTSKKNPKGKAIVVTRKPVIRLKPAGPNYRGPKGYLV